MATQKVSACPVSASTRHNARAAPTQKGSRTRATMHLTHLGMEGFSTRSGRGEGGGMIRDAGCRSVVLVRCAGCDYLGLHATRNTPAPPLTHHASRLPPIFGKAIAT